MKEKNKGDRLLGPVIKRVRGSWFVFEFVLWVRLREWCFAVDEWFVRKSI